MKTSVIQVRDMLSVLSVRGVEAWIGKVPGVEPYASSARGVRKGSALRLTRISPSMGHG